MKCPSRGWNCIAVKNVVYYTVTVSNSNITRVEGTTRCGQMWTANEVSLFSQMDRVDGSKHNLHPHTPFRGSMEDMGQGNTLS